MQRLQKVADGEAGRAGAGNKLGDKLCELAAALRGGPLDGVLGNKRAGALLRVENAAQLHLAVRARNGVGINRQLDCDAADGRELVARTKQPGRGGGLDLVDKLAIDRHATVLV